MNKDDKIKDFNGYQSFDLIPSYSDYGDVTNWQTMRRFIAHCNKYFEHLNDGIKEFLKLYESMLDTMDEFDAFMLAWEELRKDNSEFKKEIHDMLENWIDDPRLKELIDKRLLNNKLDKTEFAETIAEIDKQLADKVERSELLPITESITELNKDLSQKLATLEAQTGKKINDLDAKVKQGLDKAGQDLLDTVKTSYGHIKTTKEVVKIKNSEGEMSEAILVRVPYKNADGTVNIIKKDFANGGFNKGYSTAVDFSKTHDTVLTINGGFLNYETMYTKNMHNGNIHSNISKLKNKVNLLAWDKDGVLSTHNTDEDLNTLKSKGITNVIQAWSPIILNNQLRPELWNDTESQPDVQTIPNPRTVVGQLNNKDYLILVCTGRDYDHLPNRNKGLGNLEIGNYILNRFQSQGVNVLYNCDGGGSTQMVYKGVEQLKPLDDYKRVRRQNGEFIYFDRVPGNEVNHDYYDILKSMAGLSEQLNNINVIFDNLRSLEYATTLGFKNFNELTQTGIYYIDNSLAGKPNAVGAYGISVTIAMKYGHGLQMYIPVPQSSEPYGILACRMMRFNNKNNSYTFDEWFYWKGLKTV